MLFHLKSQALYNERILAIRGLPARTVASCERSELRRIEHNMSGLDIKLSTRRECNECNNSIPVCYTLACPEHYQKLSDQYYRGNLVDKLEHQRFTDEHRTDTTKRT